MDNVEECCCSGTRDQDEKAKEACQDRKSCPRHDPSGGDGTGPDIGSNWWWTKRSVEKFGQEMDDNRGEEDAAKEHWPLISTHQPDIATHADALITW